MISKHCQICLATVSDNSRLFILEYLKKVKREATVSEIVGELDLRQPTVTFHINKMQKAGVLTKRKDGRKVYLKLNYYSPRCKTCPVFN